METRYHTRARSAGFTLIEGLIALLGGALAMSIAVTAMLMIPWGGVDDELVVTYGTSDYPLAPSFGEMREAVALFSRFEELLVNYHAVLVHDGAVDLAWRPASGVNWLTATEATKHLKVSAILDYPGSPISDWSMGAGEGSFCALVLANERTPGGIVHYRNYVDGGNHYYEVILLAGDTFSERYEYRFYLPVEEAAWGKEPGTYPALRISGTDSLRLHDGPVSLVFPDPYLVAGDSIDGKVAPHSRFTYFFSQN